MKSLSDIRAGFLEFFRERGHAIVPSSPLVPRNDPTLLFTNAGMVQFKNVFTGAEKRPYSRATSVQKCVRAGGKHNDLDNVGYTARHHTFFEMLGNFSFGDYFKEEAILFAWDFATKTAALPRDKLLVTVYPSDEQARALWRKIAGISDARIIGHESNLWAMGPVGPCGFCSEIFYDQGDAVAGGPPGSADEDGDRYLEFWNLVFMQFEQVDADTRIDLPKPSIDTGLGLERLTAILQGVQNNYDTDLFRHLIAASVEFSGAKSEGEAKFSHRVIADHLRSTSFLIADGVLPSNDGRGYVLRRIMRRGMRHAHLIGSKDPLMYRLVPALVAEMGTAYPELKRAEALIAETLKLEETRFRETLARGLKLLDEEDKKIEQSLPAQLERLSSSKKMEVISALPDVELKDALVRSPMSEVAKIFASAAGPLNTAQKALASIQAALAPPALAEMQKMLALENVVKAISSNSLEGAFKIQAELEKIEQSIKLAQPGLKRALEAVDNLFPPEKVNELRASIDAANIALMQTSGDQIKKALAAVRLNEIPATVLNLPSQPLNRAVGNTLPGEIAFRLHDTFGFPLDLTQDALKPRGIAVDTDGFNAAMAKQRADARKAWAGSGEAATDAQWFAILDEVGKTEFLGYDTEEAEGTIVALVKDGERAAKAKAGETVCVLTNQTPFYAESGGQVGDTGTLKSLRAEGTVTDTEKKLGALYVHVVELTKGELMLGDSIDLKVDGERRRATRANHSATHLLHAALKRVLGPHVSQKGSLVAPDRLRFDFSHPKPMTQDELERVEALVNSVVRQNSDVATRLMPTDKAIEAGAEALFGEKYGEEVRVLTMGEDADKPYSVELCGGTHVRRLGDIGLFTILSESAVASGVRRIEALTSEGARQYLTHLGELAREAAGALKTSTTELPARVAQLADDRRRLERELSEAKKALALVGPSSGGASEDVKTIAGIATVLRVVEGVGAKDLKSLADDAKAKLGSGVVAFVAVADGKASLVVGVTEDLTGRFSAVDLVRLGAEALGGKGGGGRPDMAQAGGPDGTRAAEALAAIERRLGAT